MKNKFIAQKITAIQRYMPLGFLLLSAFNFICFASAAILENAQQITQNPLSDDPIAPRIIILAVVWGSIFIGSILVFLFPSPIVKGQASDKGGEVPPQDAVTNPETLPPHDGIGLSAPICSAVSESTGSTPESYPIKCLRDIELWLSKTCGESEAFCENFVYNQVNRPNKRQAFLTNLSNALEQNPEAQEILGAYEDQFLPLEQYRKQRSIPPQARQCI